MAYLGSGGSKPSFTALELQGSYPIPDFHKSIITPQGEIYLTGGRDQEGKKSSQIYYLDF